MPTRIEAVIPAVASQPVKAGQLVGIASPPNLPLPPGGWRGPGVAPTGAGSYDWNGVATSDAFPGNPVDVNVGGVQNLTAAGPVAAGSNVRAAGPAAPGCVVQCGPDDDAWTLVGTAETAASKAGKSIRVRFA